MNLSESKTGQLWSAIMFILIGILFLIDELFHTLTWNDFWPILLIASGIILILEGITKEKTNNNFKNE